MKCTRCNGNGRYVNIFGNIVRCDLCYGTGEITYGEDNRIIPIGEQKPQTNDYWRKTCSAEEFAEWISNLSYACMRCGMSNGEAYCHTGYCIQDKEDAKKWLKEMHKE